MAKGDRTAAEWRDDEDRETGVRFRQLTNYRGNTHHLYFTNPGWYRDGKSLLLHSDRGGDVNLYGIDLESGELTQLTDVPSAPPPETGVRGGCVNPRRDEAYFWRGPELRALDLVTFEERPLYTVPEGRVGGNTTVTADGRYVCTSLNDDLRGRFPLDLAHGYVGFYESWAAHPRSRIARIDVDRGGAEVVFEEDEWITHVNTSPGLPDVITFCHEGPWQHVEQRIWGLDVSRGRTWPIRPQAPGERVGHEYWFADGDHIGYQGWGTDGVHFYGSARYDDSDRVEVPFPHGSQHFHSNDFELIAGDGNRAHPYLLLWQRRNGSFAGPKVVLRHGSSTQSQHVHVHPRFSADGRQLAYTSDVAGYGNVYLVDTPGFEALPDAPEWQDQR